MNDGPEPWGLFGRTGRGVVGGMDRYRAALALLDKHCFSPLSSDTQVILDLPEVAVLKLTHSGREIPVCRLTEEQVGRDKHSCR